jgi:uncharacterized protein YwqG
MNDPLILPFELENYRQQILASVRPFIKIIPKTAQHTTWWESKIGGLPYLPAGFDYPVGQNGSALFFLAQINFAETPRLDPFPAAGILQFYIADDGLNGLDEENPTRQSNFRVLFFENVEPEETRLQTDFAWLPDFSGVPLEAGFSHPLQFELRSEAVPLTDYRVVEYLGGNFFARFGERQWEIMEAYSNTVNAGGHKLGGYAFFTQQDPRLDLAGSEENPFELLFQLDSDPAAHCLWGDMGTGNFFIKQGDLARRDFSNVMYYWDCY